MPEQLFIANNPVSLCVCASVSCPCVVLHWCDCHVCVCVQYLFVCVSVCSFVSTCMFPHVYVCVCMRVSARVCMHVDS